MKVRSLLVTSCVVLVAAGAIAGTRPRPTHMQVGRLCESRETKAASLSCFCLNADGNILACDESARAVRVVSPDDKLVTTWALPFAPQAVRKGENGLTVVGGEGQVALLDTEGKVVASRTLPGEAMARRGAPSVTSVGMSGGEVYACVSAARGYSLYRMDKSLAGEKLIVEKLRGCCGQMDMMPAGGSVYVAANCKFEVTRYDREGRETAAFGTRDGSTGYAFEGCCEPKNVCVGADGSIYTAESANCRIKRFTADGKFADHVGEAPDINSCVRVTVDVSADGSRVYLLDTENGVIRVFRQRPAARQES